MTAIPHRAGFFYSLLLMLLLYTMPITAQDRQASTFTGKVTDARTGEPIPGASVYIAGSTSGSSTDDSGSYSFSTQLTGNHHLVFSLVGYKTEPRSIELKTDRSYTINAKLEPVTIQLRELEVVSSNKEWKRDFEYFRKQFIGTTEFARETYINNPWVLDFEREGKMLKAFSKKPILVSNMALGYQIRIELLEFEWNTKTNLGVYKVLSRYKDIEANNEQQKQKWRMNRIETFLGSKAHFFRALYHGDWKEKSYLLGYEDDIEKLSEEDLKYYFLTAASKFYEIPQGWKAYRLEEYLTIKFQNHILLETGSPNRNINLQKTAGIESNRKDKIFFINKWGLLRDVASVYLHGEWAKDRVANSLPNNYTYAPREYAGQRANY